MKYKRILLKLSGEALAGEEGSGIDNQVIEDYSAQIKEITRPGARLQLSSEAEIFSEVCQVPARVLTGSRVTRWGCLQRSSTPWLWRVVLTRAGCKARYLLPSGWNPLESYIIVTGWMMHYKGYICLIAGGTGNPFFTTDSAAALRAVELGCDVLLKGTRVDGVYDSDPEKNPSARKYDTVSFDEVMAKKLG